MQNDKFKIMIMVGLSYIKKHSRWLACSQISSIWVSTKKFQKSTIGWPHQPPTENMLRFNIIFNATVKTFFSKHLNKVIFQALKTSPASLTSVASATSLTSTAQFPQKTSWSWWSDHPQHQNHQYWSIFVEWIIKNPIFHWYWVPSLSEAGLLRPAYVTFSKNFWWNSNVGYLGTC